jgi:hypothetical protein
MVDTVFANLIQCDINEFGITRLTFKEQIGTNTKDVASIVMATTDANAMCGIITEVQKQMSEKRGTTQ